MQKTLLSALAGVLALLAACSASTPGKTYLDDSDLLRSMAYTQRHLLDIEFNRLSHKTKNTPVEREALLLYSHCDLVERGIVKASVIPPFCTLSEPDGHPNASHCMQQFHQCLGGCDAIHGYCGRCELSGMKCLGLVESSTASSGGKAIPTV